MTTGPRNLITDVPGLKVGNAQDATLKSGVTCLTADAPFVVGVDVRGGAPGTRETDLLAPDKLVTQVDALVLSGGSSFGLDAASGVMAALREAGRGVRAPLPVPIVPAAIIADLGNGGDKDWRDNPYAALGREAFDTASETFEIGTAGAGTGARTGRLKGGLGSASTTLPSGVTVGALAVVNPVGCVTYPDSRAFRAWEWEEGDEFGGLGGPAARPRALTAEDTKMPRLGGATAIAIVATDATLDKAGATRLAVAAHDGVARAIAPSHTPFDGDLVFGVSTGSRPDLDPLEVMMLGHAAATVLARAVARGVYAATPADGDTKPCWSSL